MAHSYWDKLTPEQRSEEMKKRHAARKGNKKLKAHQARSRVKHYVCKQCGERLDNRYQLGNHVRYKHPKKGAKHGSSAQEEHSNHIAYLFGKVETIIEHYASSAGVPRATLAAGVAELLRHKTVR